MDHPLLRTHFITRGQSLKQAQNVYRKRRYKLMKHYPFPMVIQGVPEGITGTIPWSMTREPFYQDPLMFFLTGINQPGVSLILNPLSTSQPELLLLPKKDMTLEFWEGSQFGVGTPSEEKEVSEITGIPHCDWIDHLWIQLELIMKDNTPDKIGSFWHESRQGHAVIKEYNSLFKTKLNQWLKTHFKGCKLENISEGQYKLRLHLDAIDIANMKQANSITATTFSSILSHLHACSSEQDVHAIIAKETVKGSWMGYSFPPIVASGKRAQILHYHANNAALDPNGLLLIDMGVRYEGMPSDVTRTIPVNGRFNPLQALLYSMVLAAQKLVESLVKPGVTIHALNEACWTYIQNQIETKIIAHEGTVSMSYRLAPHQVSHLIGIAVHDGDPNRNYRTLPLKPNMVISNEPGFYGDVKLCINGITYEESVGIRIEDDLLVTKTGCKNLTSCPKTIEEIEGFLKPSPIGLS
jgi:Xaa-Pro aminopeptidase